MVPKVLIDVSTAIHTIFNRAVETATKQTKPAFAGFQTLYFSFTYLGLAAQVGNPYISRL
jgi:hypothetical protein